MLDYKLMQALAMVVREGGFERAGKALHLTQSAVSQRVKLLEQQAGQVLLVRSSPPRATPAGQEMLKHFRRVQRLEGDLNQVLAPGAEPSAQAWDTLSIALNADSLSTWFLDAVRPFLRGHRLLLDLVVDDQEQTHTLLRSGEVVGCVSARRASVQGCRVVRLGCMVYRLLAGPGFAARWFPGGVTREACTVAPAVIFNHDDEMHDKMLAGAFGEDAPQAPAHYVPSSERFVNMVLDGLGYGMVPEYQAEMHLRSGALVDLAPQLAIPVDLYWHCWDIGSPLLDGFSKALAESAWMLLASEETGQEGLPVLERAEAAASGPAAVKASSISGQQPPGITATVNSVAVTGIPGPDMTRTNVPQQGERPANAPLRNAVQPDKKKEEQPWPPQGGNLFGPE